MSILEIKNLHVTYRNESKAIRAVDDVSLSLDKGDSIGIVGESGSGKSTLAMAVLQLLDSSSCDISGEVFFRDQDILKYAKTEFDKLRWKDISVVFQKSMNALSPIHRIGEQIEEIYRVHEPGASKAHIKEEALKLFRLVNLGERVYRLYPHELSGGMLQRVSIALSLLHRPSLIILDEATTALDVVTQGQILREIKKLEQQIEMTRIMITHDMSVVATVCEKVGVMYAGRLMETGAVRDIIERPMHPYTQGLVKAYPMLKGPKEDLRIIPGSLPDLSQTVEGCIFAPRCHKAQDLCSSQRPSLRALEGRTLSCHFPEVLS